MFFQKVIKGLEDKKIRYLVIGGLAVNLYGYNRMTKDLDIMLSFDSENVNKFKELVEDLGFKPRVPVDINEISDPNNRKFWKDKKNMKVFSIFNPENDDEIVDVMIMDCIDFEEAYKNRKILSDKSNVVSVVSFDDLIKLKEISGRDRDLYDIKILKKILEKEYE